MPPRHLQLSSAAKGVTIGICCTIVEGTIVDVAGRDAEAERCRIGVGAIGTFTFATVAVLVMLAVLGRALLRHALGSAIGFSGS